MHAASITLLCWAVIGAACLFPAAAAVPVGGVLALLVAVVGLPHPKWGEAGVACIVPRSGMTVGEAELLAHLKDRIARYKQPLRVVVWDALPKSGYGKVPKTMVKARLEAAGLPVRVANLSSIWTVCYTRPSRYNWMLQYYLRAEGLALSWVGTGRLIFSLNYSAEDFASVCVRFVAAAQAMERDGWWWSAPALSNRAIKRGILREMITQRF
jgi:hypothetical protein